MNRNTTRRSLIKAVACLCAGMACGTLWPLRGVWAAASTAPSFPTRTVERGTFRFDPETGDLSWENKGREPYRLVVDGLVENPLELSYGQLRGLPRTEQVSDFHCVEGWSLEDIPWAGFSPAELIKRARPKPDAAWVVLHSLGATSFTPEGQSHYVECFPLADLTAPGLDYLFALDLGGEPLPGDRGAPLRLVTPFDLAYKSIKFVRRVEFTPRPRRGWWSLANSAYPVFAPVPPRRLDEPEPERTPYSERSGWPPISS
ncbi:molybdopterin-dependent oxidoreductase [Desulfohalovibrio reitneri]|uniref:molybdopterin-dependent oxidoreductase n=1 Tax=Desulfohalovibrio reitneri TaxID=1307759 RepID=UPI00068DBF65|nr:molybdopterin-dependent oxidoreductase [Desulfohalovibrio reitneri]